MKELRLAFSSLGCPSYSVEQIVESATAFGYRGVSLRTVRGESMLPSLDEFSPRTIGKTASLFAKAGVEVVCVSSGVRFTSPEAGERDKQLAIAGQYLDIASALGSKYVRVFGGPYPPDADRKSTTAHIVEGFRGACALAEAKGLSIILETHDSFSRGDSALALLRAVDRENLVVVWDILHSLRFGESFTETWAHIGPYIRHVHIKDSLIFGPEGFDIKLLGRGTIPIREALLLLLEKGYEGLLEFEWEKGWHPEVEGPEIAFPHAVGYIEALWQELSRGGA